jgi:hypothetical protein
LFGGGFRCRSGGEFFEGTIECFVLWFVLQFQQLKEYFVAARRSFALFTGNNLCNEAVKP